MKRRKSGKYPVVKSPSLDEERCKSVSPNGTRCVRHRLHTEQTYAPADHTDQQGLVWK